MTDQYNQFVERKFRKKEKSGFHVTPEEIHKKLFDFQNHIVREALSHGRYAIFAECGLGKTFMQLEWARHVSDKFGKVLILAPLAVSGQTNAKQEIYETLRRCVRYARPLSQSEGMSNG